jgi:hypothetical protein
MIFHIKNLIVYVKFIVIMIKIEAFIYVVDENEI